MAVHTPSLPVDIPKKRPEVRCDSESTAQTVWMNVVCQTLQSLFPSFGAPLIWHDSYTKALFIFLFVTVSLFHPRCCKRLWSTGDKCKYSDFEMN